MKKKKEKYLKYYQEWIKSGRMPTEGLCETFGSESLWPEYLEKFPQMRLVSPTQENLNDIIDRQGRDAALYWGSVNGEDHYVFNPLRQNIVLLMAALNNEL